MELDKKEKRGNEQQTLDKFGLKEKIKDITSKILSKLPMKERKD